MTVKQLQAADARYRRALERAGEQRDKRDDTIRAAVQAGWSFGDIADALHITKSRVAQIANAAQSDQETTR